MLNIVRLTSRMNEFNHFENEVSVAQFFLKTFFCCIFFSDATIFIFKTFFRSQSTVIFVVQHKIKAPIEKLIFTSAKVIFFS